MADLARDLVQFDEIRSGAVLAHEVIYERHRRLVVMDRADDASQSLLREAAQIALHHMPNAWGSAQALRAVLNEQELLDPQRAPETRDKLEAALAAALPALKAMRRRQDEIAAELRRRFNDG